MDEDVDSPIGLPLGVSNRRRAVWSGLLREPDHHWSLELPPEVSAVQAVEALEEGEGFGHKAISCS